jgi:hypothetical protein
MYYSIQTSSRSGTGVPGNANDQMYIYFCDFHVNLSQRGEIALPPRRSVYDQEIAALAFL